MKAIVGQLPGLILGIVGAVLIALLLDKWAIAEPRLVHTGGPMLVPHIIGSMMANGEMETFVKHAVPLKNLGFRSGHVDKVVLSREGLFEPPVSITVLHVDKTDLGWREEREISFEFIIPSKEFTEKEKNLAFKT